MALLFRHSDASTHVSIIALFYQATETAGKSSEGKSSSSSSAGDISYVVAIPLMPPTPTDDGDKDIKEEVGNDGTIVKKKRVSIPITDSQGKIVDPAVVTQVWVPAGSR
jgi:hypothetical protein